MTTALTIVFMFFSFCSLVGATAVSQTRDIIVWLAGSAVFAGLSIAAWVLA